eukprot:m.142782 g.142782  ORF g.142782 m.142782 type:complete len:380 (+) comp14083_c0_seq1:241-1380(+)
MSAVKLKPGESMSGTLAKLDRTNGSWIEGLDARATGGKMIVGKKVYPVSKTSSVIEVNEMDDMYDIWDGLPYPSDLPGYCFALVYWRGEKQQVVVLSARGGPGVRKQWKSAILFEAQVIDEGQYAEAWNPDETRGAPPGFQQTASAPTPVIRPPPPRYQRPPRASVDEGVPPETPPKPGSKGMQRVPWEPSNDGSDPPPPPRPARSTTMDAPKRPPKKVDRKPMSEALLGTEFGKPTADPQTLPDIPPPPSGRGAADPAMAEALLELELHCVFELQAHLPQGMGGWIVTRSIDAGAPGRNTLVQYDVVFECNDISFAKGSSDICTIIDECRADGLELAVYNLKTQQYRIVELARGSRDFDATVRPCKLNGLGSENARQI